MQEGPQKVTPLEAIRNTKEIKIKSAKLKTPAIIGRIWGIGGVISYKNIKRNKKKVQNYSDVYCYLLSNLYCDIILYVYGL